MTEPKPGKARSHGELKQKIVDYINACGPVGCTAMEVAAFLGHNAQTMFALLRGYTLAKGVKESPRVFKAQTTSHYVMWFGKQEWADAYTEGRIAVEEMRRFCAQYLESLTTEFEDRLKDANDRAESAVAEVAKVNESRQRERQAAAEKAAKQAGAIEALKASLGSERRRNKSTVTRLEARVATLEAALASARNQVVMAQHADKPKPTRLMPPAAVAAVVEAKSVAPKPPKVDSFRSAVAIETEQTKRTVIPAPVGRFEVRGVPDSTEYGPSFGAQWRAARGATA